ncbi:polymorphic toxin-type HINT domain-containing protein [Amycolatopsis sp. cmx-11-32]|uniref:polymorphic toxin-type HINT domain-containing protein n=1 Tax=Amycolatopsis sp. cmx-11-32 TaxID=2785796 RepID=UPI0039E41D5B
MGDGSCKPIKDVEDPTTGRSAVRVKMDARLHVSQRTLVEVGVAGEVGRRSVVATDEHPFWVASEKRWSNAVDLKAGHRLETGDHRDATVTGTRSWSETRRVYNLTADGDHTYFVIAGQTPVLTHNCGGDESYYRTMSQGHFDSLEATGRLSATRETFISPTRAFSEDYDGILVRFTVRKGTTESLSDIGVRDASAASARAFPNMGLVSRGWRETSAFFKGKGAGHVNIGLGGGKALDIFNDGIVGFERLR